ncbi:MAG: amidoligase family protein [bacterium]|nr:amidoligase family protein [bacterium]
MRGLLINKYNNLVYNNQNIFNLEINNLINYIFNNNLEYLFSDDLVCEYISNFLKNNKIYNNIYNLLSYENITKYFKSNELIEIIYLLNDEEKINIFNLNHIKKQYFNNNYLIFRNLDLRFNDFNNYEKILSNLDEKEKIIILRGISNEDYISSYLNNFKIANELYLFIIVSKFKKDENLIKFVDNFKSKNYKSQIIYLIKDEKYKFKYFNEMNKYHQIEFLKTQSDEIKIKYIERGIYPKILIANLKNLDLLFSYFLKYKTYESQVIILKNVSNDIIKFELFKLMNLEGHYMDVLVYLLRSVKDKNVKKSISLLLDDKGIEKVIKSNENKEEILDNINTSIDYIVDPSITFGIELECSTFYNEAYISIGQILSKWIIKEERTVNNGLEITSPVLSYTEKDLKELKYICDFLCSNNFEETPDCGGHIHIGFDYFKSVNEIKMLYYLFIHCEEILYLICNKCNSLIRPGVKINARKIKETIVSQFGKYIGFKVDKINDFVNIISSIQTDRYYSINILNALSLNKNTIEFRMPNGEINFEELKLNIILFARLVSKAKELSHISTDDRKYNDILLLSEDILIEHKKDIFLDLMFDEVDLKNIFYDRFESNYELNKENYLQRVKK